MKPLRFYKLNCWVFFSILCLVSSLSYAKEGSISEDDSFLSSAQQQQFQRMEEQLRCLVCQNQSLWDSSAPLAKDLRTEVRKQIKQGKSEAQIKQYLVDRYGQFILFKPTVNRFTYVLWVTPFILLLLAFLVVGYMVFRSKQRPI